MIEPWFPKPSSRRRSGSRAGSSDARPRFDKPGQGHSVPLTGYDEYEAEVFRCRMAIRS